MKNGWEKTRTNRNKLIRGNFGAKIFFFVIKMLEQNYNYPGKRGVSSK
jgi:hypothetical protein